MSDVNPVRGIADTARWVAYFRAQETNRPDALFRDPYAERLAGDRGFEIASNLSQGSKHDWAWAARTYLFDEFLSNEIKQGADLVLNLAAGLDARPYRLNLPPDLCWIEVDFHEIISYKENILSDDSPRCRLQRASLDLLNTQGRRLFFEELNSQFRKIVVMCEGLLIYFTAEQVASLALDLARGDNFTSWIIDLASPGQLDLMKRNMGQQLMAAGAEFKFAPADRADFFVPYGWAAHQIRGLLQTAADLKRAPASLLSLLPEPKGPIGNYPWTGVCQLHKV